MQKEISKIFNTNILKSKKKDTNTNQSVNHAPDFNSILKNKNEGKVKKIKLFFVSDMDEEALYLHEMSLQGLHFTGKSGLYYVFKKEEPENYYYHLGYYENDKRDGKRYIDNYTEAGWDNIFHERGEFGGIWNYFRIKIQDDEVEPNIFSDRVSRIALYKRLLSSWRSLLAMILICAVFIGIVSGFLLSRPSWIQPYILTFCGLVVLTMIVIFAVYTRIYIKIRKKLIEFNY